MNKKNQKIFKIYGLTLIELLLVITLVGFLASIAIPGVTGWINRAKVKNVAYELLSDIQYVQSLALAKGESKIIFSSNSYTAEADGNTIFTKTIPSGITISASFTLSSNILEFERNKLPTSNGTIEISGYGITYKIIVSHISGRIRMETSP
ncbi:prepilin-type N-terminal cleavage/methylation domain-containing protein [Thermodesulfatator autotrophicus]|uniref:General secretion pathway GspH domain-containing protein n=1 Tax=Thermodesulfatator autotrophicus TaxID=1795632 RepID=A0A177E7D2_9BACT|nr:prepilin-type N-terminal cleavage/methylation domain-containing protein [Thermodesulfatator autotrophicus]OAG27698.1 hypothetical protein TH606_05745 [Thermodesulfatator autotrophicus]